MSRNDDEDDNRPRRRRRDDDNDDADDRPRSRRRDDEDDYDDRPRRPRKKKGGMGTTAVVIGLVALFGCCGLGGVGAFFGVWRVREAAGRARDSNNLKQIGLGMHTHNDAQARLPEADGDVSWRVHLLPYIEQDRLYTQFDLNQAWDSPKNRKHADVRITQFVSAADPPDSTQTRYRVFVGPGTLFEPGKPPKKLSEITDGTTNTLLVVEAAETVPWPQPKELPFSPNGSLPAIGHPSRSNALVVMVDGSVRVVKKDLDPAVFRAVITPAGKDRVPDDW
jgi:hypothetical protein